MLSYEYIPHTECIYEGVKKLPPAHNLLLTKNNIHISEYWNLDYREKLDISDNVENHKIDEEKMSQ